MIESAVMPPVDVTRTHLELRALADLRRARQPAETVELALRHPIGADEYRDLYRLVGDRWFWRDRLIWTDDELESYLGSGNVQIWVPRVHGKTAGYFELQRHGNGSVEIMYFGLAPAFIGRGIGGWLLTRAAEEAFALGGERVILNTCTLDGPHALPNYLARGFTIVREEHYLLDIPQGAAAPAGVSSTTARG
jgi:ribosomal protein S18 acetylase RimI-like enzyme